jgi:hypothetical protein
MDTSLQSARNHPARLAVVSTIMRIIDPSIAGVFESWEPYKDFFYTDHRGWAMPDTDKIKSLADAYDFVVANCSTEHWGSERDFPLVVRVHDILADHFNTGFVCLCHDPSDEDLRPGILYFSFFAWRKQWRLVDPNRISISDRTYLFSNLNLIARDFRIANYLCWQQQPYAAKSLISMHNVTEDHHDYDGHFGLTDEELSDWQQTLPTLPSKICDGFNLLFDVYHPAFRDSYLHLVSESTIKDKIFLTEKTWQPILAGQLFMVWGNPGIITHLRNLGVDVFDDIIDHEYDTISDHRTRLQYIHKELNRLSLLNWQQIYRDTNKRRQDNSDSFVTGKFIAKVVDKLKLRLPPGIL